MLYNIYRSLIHFFFFRLLLQRKFTIILVLGFLQIEHPCIPCIDECSRSACDESCEIAETVLKTFTLSNLTLPSKKITVNDTGHEIQQIVTYYFTGALYTIEPSL